MVLFEAVPTRLDDQVVNGWFALFKGNMPNQLFRAHAWSSLEMITQVPVHERQFAAECVAEK